MSAKPRRIAINFGDMVQELSVQLDISEKTVDKLLRAYAAANMRLLVEGLSTEIIPGVRLYVEDYFIPRFAKTGKRIVVDPATAPVRSGSPTDDPLQQEYDRSVDKLGNPNPG